MITINIVAGLIIGFLFGVLLGKLFKIDK